MFKYAQYSFFFISDKTFLSVPRSWKVKTASLAACFECNERIAFAME